MSTEFFIGLFGTCVSDDCETFRQQVLPEDAEESGHDFASGEIARCPENNNRLGFWAPQLDVDRHFYAAALPAGATWISAAPMKKPSTKKTKR
jgi:hypothetical protein